MLVAAVAAASLALPGRGGPPVGPSLLPPPVTIGAGATAVASSVTPGAIITGASASPAPTAPTPAPTATTQPFALIDMFAPYVPPTPAPTRKGPTPRPGPPLVDPGRDTPSQSFGWLVAKASGRIVLSDGKIGLLAVGEYPLVDVATGGPLPDKKALDVSWSRWIVEPTASGTDARGNTYRDLTYWNLCGPGAATVALYYWQQETGYPNVTGMSGYFVEPYEESGVAWPNPGPTFRGTDGKYHRLGTYWTGQDKVPGFTARGRGYLMYMAMAVQPEGWTTPGIDVFAGGDGKPLYPTRGSQPDDTQAALNWEASGHAASWAEAWYATVNEWDPTMERDLLAAVMLDVGRDGVPVVASADTFYLPNWQNGSRTPHTRHSVTIVGYDNAASPPTYTYLDSCGRSCNSRAGNANGKVHTVTQAQMVKAVSLDFGMGFLW